MPTSFELTLDDSSPIISYFPFAETLGASDLLAGWNSFFSESGFLSELGQVGIGTSLHVTSDDGAALTIQWFGTGITLFGSVFQATYDVSLDGAAPFLGLPRADILTKFQGLQAKQHLIALIAHPIAAQDNSSSYVAFDRATLNVTTDLTGAIITSEFINATNDRWFLSGNWTQLSDPVLALEPSQDYQLSTSIASAATISFRGSAVSVTGIRNITHGHYNVTLDGTTTTFDGHSDWLEPSMLFLQAGLDENTKHSLTVTNAENASLAISGLNITHISGGTLDADSPSPGLPTGTTVGLLLTAVIVIVAIVCFCLCVYVRHHRQRDHKHGYTVERGIRSSFYIHDSAGVLSPRRRQQPPKHLSRFSDYARQGSAAQVVDSQPTVLTPSWREPVDPASPTPYLRLTRPTSPTVGLADGERRKRTGEHTDLDESSGYRGRRVFERPRLDTIGEGSSDSTETMVQDILDTYSSPGSPTAPQPTHDYTTSRTGNPGMSVDCGPSGRLHADITSENLDVTAPKPTTFQGSRRTMLLLVSPKRRPRHNSFRTSQAFSPTQDSISTIRFGQPSRESGGSELTNVEGPWLLAPKSEVATAQSKPSGTPKDVRAAQISYWKPPW